MKNKKNGSVKRQNSMHVQINCKTKLELKKDNENKLIYKKSFDLSNNSKKDYSLYHEKRNSFNIKQKIILKPINKKISETKKTIDITSSIAEKANKTSKSGKNIGNKFRNRGNIKLMKNQNDQKKYLVNFIDKETKPKFFSEKKVFKNFEEEEINENKIKKNIDYEYKDDKIEILYNSSNNLIYSSATQKGFFIKTKSEKENNQDVSIIIENACGIKNYNIYCIMDGHGSNGHLVSNYIKKKIIQNLNNISFYFHKIIETPTTKEYPDNILELIKNKLEKNNYKAIKDLYKLIDDGLYSKEIFFDINFSGSTCIIVFQIGKYIICSNVGDSRAILIKENYEIVELSKDHKPEDENEKIRIKKMGGIISQCNDLYDDGKEGGPFRIWVKGCDYPGIAMSRSIGDKIAHDIGVISEPEILNFNIDEKSKCILIGSDGIWQYLKNEKVLEIIRPFIAEKNAEKSVKEIIRKASLAWIENDSIVDDITISVIF